MILHTDRWAAAHPMTRNHYYCSLPCLGTAKSQSLFVCLGNIHWCHPLAASDWLVRGDVKIQLRQTLLCHSQSPTATTEVIAGFFLGTRPAAFPHRFSNCRTNLTLKGPFPHLFIIFFISLRLVVPQKLFTYQIKADIYLY